VCQPWQEGKGQQESVRKKLITFFFCHFADLQIDLRKQNGC
jgi:hypothetical protein